MKINRVLFLLFVNVLWFFACERKTPPQKSTGKSFSFIFMTDIHLQPENNGIPIFNKAIQRANLLKPNFVITGGDNIRDALGQSWERSDSLYNLFITKSKKLEAPVYTTLGNHDIFGLYNKTGEWLKHPEYGKNMYENRLVNRFYSFDFRNWHFVILDSNGINEKNQYIGFIDSLQIAWLKNDLEQLNKNTPIVIISHIPLLSVERLVLVGFEDGIPNTCLVTNARKVIEILQRHNVKMVLQGHSHFREDILYNEIHFISGGAVNGLGWNEKLEKGFLKIDVSEEDFEYKYIKFEEEL
jgi:Icc protein